MQTRVLIILILAGLFCGFVINVGAPAFAFVWVGLSIEKIVWTPNTGFTLYVESNCDANVTQILVNDVPQNVTSPELPFALKSTLDPAFVVAFPYTNGTSYDISVVTSDKHHTITRSFQGGTNWAVPPPPPPPYYAPLVTVGLVATLVESFLLSVLCSVQTERTKHLIKYIIMMVFLAWVVASVFVFIYFQPPLVFA